MCIRATLPDLRHCQMQLGSAECFIALNSWGERPAALTHLGSSHRQTQLVLQGGSGQVPDLVALRV